MENDRLVFHIDVNSAYLSWEAAYRLQHGEKVDLREIPSVVGGDPKSRHGIVLAKSIPAKAYNIHTGESIFVAKQKCPNIVIVPPRYQLYMKCSNALIEILREYTPNIQRYSVDECFLDFTNSQNMYPDFLKLANEIKDRVKRELGFTVNIGISNNKLLAKMASDLKKPNMVHTLFPNEIKEKMWPLPVEELFMVGRATAPKLKRLNINTIGDLANCDKDFLKSYLKSFGVLIWEYANGIESSAVKKSNHIDMKGLGNSTTIAFDVEDRETAHMIIISLCETIGMRLRDSKNSCFLVAVSIKDSNFITQGRQRKYQTPTDNTGEIIKRAWEIFDELWRGQKIRHIGVSVSELIGNELYQISMFDEKNIEKNRSLDKTLDTIRMRYGNDSIVRASFINSGFKPLMGGVGEEDYPLMSSIL